MSQADLIIAVGGGTQGVITSGGGVSIVSAGGQAITGIVSAVGPVGGAIATNPAAAMLTVIKITIDANQTGQIEVGDVLSVVGNGVAIAGATAAIVPGGQAIGAGLIFVGRLVAVAGIVATGLELKTGTNIFDGSYPSITYNDVFPGPVPRSINPATNTAYRIARSANQGAQSPLVLDLDGDGIEIAQLPLGASTATRFDHNADGIRTGTAWVKGDDGLLVLDRNGNGAIDSGREAFGDNTLLASGQKAADGYAALADLDSNHDGQITALDSAFTQLQVWRDLDQDGVSDSGELQTLTQAGITRIGLAKTASTQTLSDGTRLDGSASFTLNGQTRSYTDAWFAENAFYREFTDTIPLTAATLGVADAPQEVPLWDMQGAGMVRDLREAASLDATIVSDVQNLTGASRTQMMNGLDPLISHWADTSAFKTSIQTADDQGFKLVYLPPGMTVLDYWKIQGMMAGGTSGGTSPELSETERTRLDALKAQQETYVKMIGILERFNGLHFVTVNNGTSVTTAQGQGQLIEAIALPTGYVPPEATGTGVCAPIYAYVPLNVEQTPLLERSYAQLKDSVYDGLAIQTRLKPYLDTISLSIDASGIKIDYSGIDAMNEFEWKEVA